MNKQEVYNNMDNNNTIRTDKENKQIAYTYSAKLVRGEQGESLGKMGNLVIYRVPLLSRLGIHS